MSESHDPDRDELTAYLDGELDERASAAMETRLRRDPALQHEAETLKRTWDLLDFLPQPEPSPTFTSQTLDKLSVRRPASTGMSRPTARPSRRTWQSRGGFIAASLALFVMGYLAAGPFLTSGPPRLGSKEAEEQMARDLRLIDQLPLFALGGDMEFLLGLDHPDLFGE